jgi:hypothetical protein
MSNTEEFQLIHRNIAAAPSNGAVNNSASSG